MKTKRVCLIEGALGLALMGQRKLAGAVESLQKKGAKGKRTSQKFLHDVQAEGAEGKKRIGRQFRDSAKNALSQLGFASTEDVAQVHKEIGELKAMLNPAHTAEV